ncbi:MAG TPA: hypothetical protein VE287_04150 [Actinopolymorphaceae bacterium]|jgi:hypothetical protein|nr:hypothetical protein [Actinopolymorphaceae bacterium]
MGIARRPTACTSAYAMNERTAAHHRALRWAHALAWQVRRLDSTRREAYIAQERRPSSGFQTPTDAEPFHRLEADRHFTLTAARNLLRALRAFDGDLRLPAGLSHADVYFLRDTLEHWDEPTGPARTRADQTSVDPEVRARGANGGGGRRGPVVNDRSLLIWADQVYADLLRVEVR